MAAEFVMVDVMSQNPASCVLCALAPVDETTQDRRPLPAIEAVGLDVNWGDTVYVCQVCIGLMADMIGRPSTEKVNAARTQVKFQTKRADKAEQKVAKLQERLTKILEGKKAIREAREEEAKTNGQ